MANNDNQGVISENNPIISTESEKPLENQTLLSEPKEIKPEIGKTPENSENAILKIESHVSILKTQTANSA